MRIITLLLGIIGGLISLAISINILFFGTYEEVLSIYHIGTLKNLNMAAIPLSILGILGGINATTNPKTASKLLLFSALGLFLLFRSPNCYIGSTCLLIAGILSSLTDQNELFSESDIVNESNSKIS